MKQTQYDEIPKGHMVSLSFHLALINYNSESYKNL